MNNRPFISTLIKLPNVGDVVEVKSHFDGRIYKCYYYTDNLGENGLPRFVECDDAFGRHFASHREWRHFSERYADYLDRRAQGWSDSTQDGFPKDREAVWVYDTHSKEVVHCTHRKSGGGHDWHPVVCSPALYVGDQIYRPVKFVKKVTVAEVPEDAPAAPVIKPVPVVGSAPAPAPEAIKAVWVAYNSLAPADGQFVWVHTGTQRLVCKHREAFSLFECVVGTETGRKFHATACLWQTLLPPAT